MTPPRIVIVGAGPAGIVATIKLKQAGFERITLLERSDDIGGTWHNTHYPGFTVDIQGSLYCYSFAQKSDWSRTFPTQPEVKAYLREVAERYDVVRHLELGIEVTSAAWNHDGQHWRIRRADGSSLEAEFLLTAVGMFNEVHWPALPGLERFRGPAAHTAQWPADLDLHGARVAVIGSAASAVQCIPVVADQAAHLVVYQRTANWVFPKDDKEHSAADLAAMRADPRIGLAHRQEVAEFLERWLSWSDEEILGELRQAGLDNLALVEDPETRAKLEPQLPIGAQRPLLSNVYYQTFNRRNVELVTEPIQRITPDGILTADGVERPADILVLATGYTATKFASIIDITGREGRSLRADWSAGAQAFKGMVTTGYPNLFMLYGPNTNNGSLVWMFELQADYIVRKIQLLGEHGIGWLDVRPDAQDDYNDEVQRHIAELGIWDTPGSKYYRAASGRIVTQWPLNMAGFERYATAPDIDAFDYSGGAFPGR